MKVSAHIIHRERGFMSRQLIECVPRVGDEIRMPGEKYYKVTLVVWVFDEPDHPYQRVNIGVIDAPDED